MYSKSQNTATLPTNLSTRTSLHVLLVEKLNLTPSINVTFSKIWQIDFISQKQKKNNRADSSLVCLELKNVL